IGLLLKRVAGGWETMGGGPFAILDDRPRQRPGALGPEQAVDPAVQAPEVRQMLEAKSQRRQQRGEAPLDVEAETQRLLAESERPRGAEAIDVELRGVVGPLVGG